MSNESNIRTVITGTGSYIPPHNKTNKSFETQHFYTETHERIVSTGVDIVNKFEQITGIRERRYANADIDTSGMAALAGLSAIHHAGIDPETIDQVIVAHNFADIAQYTIQSDAVPSLASRVKHHIGIKNPSCIAYDILFGCPGWLQGIIQADLFIRAGAAKRCLVIGAEKLSSVIDAYDRDSMIFSDGAGAVIIEAKTGSDSNAGCLGSKACTFSTEELNYINMGISNLPGADPSHRYLKMQGRKVYEFALKHVPEAIRDCMDSCGINIAEIKKIFIHQANEKMDGAIIKALYKLYNADVNVADIMPMNIHLLGNSSVATLPTLYDMVCRHNLHGHELKTGDIIVFASVGAGMNINAMCYRC